MRLDRVLYTCRILIPIGVGGVTSEVMIRASKPRWPCPVFDFGDICLKREHILNDTRQSSLYLSDINISRGWGCYQRGNDTGSIYLLLCPSHKIYRKVYYIK